MDVQELTTSLSIVRHLRAPPERVFEAWTDPKILAKWFIPNAGFTVPKAETDVRVGGRYVIEMHSAEGKVHKVGGAYKEIVPNKRLVFSWIPCEEPGVDTLVTIELRPLDGATTELTLTHERLPSEKSRAGHESGWNGCLNSLERYFQ